jgi:hypothetical protein
MLNPFAVVVGMLLNVAVPPDSVAVPSVLLPTLKVTVPVIVPAVVEDTEAVILTGEPTMTLVGVTVTDVEVAGSAANVMVVLPTDPSNVVSPE